MSLKKPKIIVILGPTATGKSDLAVRLAKKFNGEVVSADSRQVYKGMDVGTGKITSKEMRGVPHYLIDVANPKRRFTVVQYKKLAEKVISDIWKRGKLPILCGGTGLYIDALIYDWKLPKVKPNLKLRKELEKKSAEELFEQLKKLDPDRVQNIDPYNKRRLVRALEIVIQTGKSSHSNILPILSVAEGQNVRMSKHYDVLKIGVRLPNEELKKRIDKRLLKRIRRGMIKEVKNLQAQGLSFKRLDDLGLEYRWVVKYLQGEITKLQMIEKLKTEIWRYAKRQMTWFKRDKNIRWVSKNSEVEKLVGRFLK